VEGRQPSTKLGLGTCAATSAECYDLAKI
jgi:hypothetical protein